MNEVLILLPLVLALALAFPVMGFVAFLRVDALTHALRRAEARIAALEDRFGARQAAQEAPPPEAPPIAAPERPRLPLFARVEKALASNWFVWLGGALIALAIVSLLHFAIAAGYFGPRAQLASAYLVGAALVAAAEWLRRAPPPAPLAHTQLTRLPALLAALGLFAFFAATFAGYASLHVLTVRAAFALMALSALAAILAALRFGRALAALGMLGAYLAPALVQSAAPSPPALFGYLIALSAAALAIIRLRRWRGFVWLAGAGALAWGVVWTTELIGDAGAHRAAALYILALAALGFAFAWTEADAAPLLHSWRALRASWSEPTLAAHVLALAAGADLFFLARHAGYQPALLIAILAFCVLTCIVGYLRERFAMLALAAVALAAATILAWPAGDLDAPPLAESNFFLFCGAFGFVFTAGGWLMMLVSRAKAPGATLAALGPAAIVLASHIKAAALRSAPDWSAAALGLMTLDIFALWQMKRAFGGLEKAPGPSAAFALGAAAGAILAVLFALTDQPLWSAAALALLAPAIAALDLRFRLPALRAANALIALLVAWLLGPSLHVFFAPLPRTPLINPILPAYGLAAGALWGAAFLYRRSGTAIEARIVQALEAAALIVGALGVNLEIRHLATGGDLGAPAFGLAELAGDTIAWLGLALGLAARFGPRPRALLFWAEAIAVAVAAGLALIGAALIDNPWWGLSPQDAPGWPIVNLLLAAYGLPAALFAAYAILRRRQGLPRRGALAGAAAAVMAFLNVTLEVRRLYHPGAMAMAPIGQWEAWSYTAAWISFAAALLGLGLIRRQPSLRYASLIVLLVAIMKAFGFDIHALNSVLLAAQLLGLGVSVIAVTIIYQRFVAPRGGRVDPNLIPPR